jgi:copper homeostasis protein CutC
VRQYRTEIDIRMWDDVAHAPGAKPDLLVTLHINVDECADPRDMLTEKALETALDEIRKAKRFAG